MSLLARRPRRYVPRHSTREPFRRWNQEEIVDVTAAEKSPSDVLQSVLAGLDGLDDLDAGDRRPVGA
ncbi:hypothetical protein [Kineococcus sp. SYSU DK003]|uniref:hypothetical protein n=1 Tax=Kineococcus sp. SYSU DK003 TaxID=3383124 RepID=UPI003D7E5992